MAFEKIIIRKKKCKTKSKYYNCKFYSYILFKIIILDENFVSFIYIEKKILLYIYYEEKHILTYKLHLHILKSNNIKEKKNMDESIMEKKSKIDIK